VCRNVAVGGASTFARIGSMSAPYIVDILGEKKKLIFLKFSLLKSVVHFLIGNNILTYLYIPSVEDHSLKRFIKFLKNVPSKSEGFSRKKLFCAP